MNASEREINRRFEVLSEQRNSALNTVVLLHGELSEARATLAETQSKLDASLGMLSAMADAQEKQDATA